MKDTHNHERAPKRHLFETPSIEYIDKSPSNRYNRPTKRSNTTQPTTSSNAFEPLMTASLDTGGSFDFKHGRNQHEEESHRKPLASNTHYFLSAASSLQHRIPPFASSLSAHHGIGASTSNSFQLSTSRVTDETTRDQHDKQAEKQASKSLLEQDHQAADFEDRMVAENGVKLYGRYLQWEWVALELENWIKQQKLCIKEQLLEAQNTCTEAGPSSSGEKDYLKYWEQTYLLPIQEGVGLLESEGLDAKVADDCLLEIKTAMDQLNHLKEKIPRQTHCIYMNFLDDCFHYMQDIYKDMINISYASLLDSV